MRFGDFLNNVRASLDYLAWELTHNGGKQPELPWRVSFPIVTGGRDAATRRGAMSAEEVWASTIKTALNGADPLHVGIVKRHQPYVGGQPAQDPLTWLQSLVNVDKHQALHVVVPRALKIPKMGQPFDIENFQITKFVPATNLTTSEPGTELLRVYGTAGPGEPNIKVNFPAWEMLPAAIETIGPIEVIGQKILARVGGILAEFDKCLD